MVTHMKTTVELPNALLSEAKRVAAREKITLRELLEQSLRRVLEEHGDRPAGRFEPVVFHGSGLQPEFEGASWEKIREAIYEGHGG